MLRHELCNYSSILVYVPHSSSIDGHRTTMAGFQSSSGRPLTLREGIACHGIITCIYLHTLVQATNPTNNYSSLLFLFEVGHSTKCIIVLLMRWCSSVALCLMLSNEMDDVAFICFVSRSDVNANPNFNQFYFHCISRYQFPNISLLVVKGSLISLESRRFFLNLDKENLQYHLCFSHQYVAQSSKNFTHPDT